MWQMIYNRALVMFAQATGGAPGAPPVRGERFEHQPIHTILLVVYFVICLGLVMAVLLQTSKSEGLSGIIGGSTQSVFKGKKGLEERLSEFTNYLAIAYVVMSLLVSIFAFRVK